MKLPNREKLIPILIALAVLALIAAGLIWHFRGSNEKIKLTADIGSVAGDNSGQLNLPNVPEVSPEDQIVTAGETIPLLWTDDNTNENLIIKTDKKYYDGSGQTQVYLGITNTTPDEQKADIYFWFDNGQKKVEKVEKIEGGQISNDKFLISNKFPNPNVKNRKDVKGYTNGSNFQDTIPAGQINYYKAVIKYPANQNQSEFFIEVFGQSNSSFDIRNSELAYGHLDPYLAGGLVGYWSFNGPDTQLPDNNEASRVFDEKFEGTGYEESGWAETVPGGCTVDEDASSADVGSPSGWGSQCLKILSTGANTLTMINPYSSSLAVFYWRAEFIITAESIGNGGEAYFLSIFDDTPAYLVVANFGIQKSGTVYNLKLQSYHDGVSNNYTALSTLSLNTKYRLEFKWDATANKWAWRLDGVDQPNDQDAISPITAEGNLTSTHATDIDSWRLGTTYADGTGATIYYDLFAIDTATWVGAEGYTKDMSAQGNHGNSVGMIKSAAVPGISGQALKFDGADDYVDAGDPANGSLDWGTGNGSVSMWVKTSDTSDYQRLFSKKQGSTASVGYSFSKLDAGDVVFTVADGTYADQTDSGSNNIEDGKWHHIVGTWEYGVAAKIYIDGQLNSTDNTISVVGSLDTADNFVTGRRSDTAANYFNGLIDEVRIYNRALTDDEILQLYRTDGARSKINISKALAGPQGGLVGNWTFNGTDTLLPDNNGASRVFDEKFEGTGYEETGWTEEIVAGDTVDEDAVSSDVGSPLGWGSQSLKVVTAGTGGENKSWSYNHLSSAQAISYYRTEVVVTATNVADGLDVPILYGWDSSWTEEWRLSIQNTGGVYRFQMVVNRTGAMDAWYLSLNAINLNTKYRFEVKWDATNDKWSWKIDGVAQPNDQDGTDPVTTEGNLTSTHPTDFYYWACGANNLWPASFTAYYDLVAIDTATWVGAEGYTKDLSGQGNHGDPVNMTKSAAVPGISGQALKFDGVDDYIADVGGNSSFVYQEGDYWSVSLWLKTTTDFSGINNGRALITKGTGDAIPGYGVVIGQLNENGYNNKIGFVIDKSTGNNRAVSIDSLPTANDGNWHHAVVVFDANSGPNVKGTIYFDSANYGTLSSAVSITGWATTNSYAADIAAAATDPGYPYEYFAGSIDEVRIYNRALTPSEVTQLYQAGASRLKVNTPITLAGSQGSSLVGNWTFNGPDIALPDNNEASRIVDEKFEGTGYEESWSEGNVGAGCTADEDYSASSIPGAPANWGSQSLRIYSAAETTNFIVRDLDSDKAISYARIEVIWDTFPTGAGPWLRGVANGNSAASPSAWNLYLQREAGGDYKFYITYYSGGSDVVDVGASALAEDTLYRVEIKYDVTNMQWEWKVNGVSEGSAAMTASTRAGVRYYTLGPQDSSTKAMECFYDLAAFNETAWPGDEGYITDLSGQANNGDSVGMTKSAAVPGISGQALNFDGVDDYVSVPYDSDFNVTTGLTLAAWYKPLSVPAAASAHYIVFRRANDSVTPNWGNLYRIAFDDTANFQMSIFNGTNWGGATSNLSYSINNWYFVVGTFDGTNEKIYINGADDTSGGTTAGSIPSSNYGIDIGYYSLDSGANYCNGPIDEVRIYNRALTDSEILQLYQAGTRRVKVKQ